MELKWEHLVQVVHKHVALRSNDTLYQDIYMKSRINFNVSETWKGHRCRHFMPHRIITRRGTGLVSTCAACLRAQATRAACRQQVKIHDLCTQCSS